MLFLLLSAFCSTLLVIIFKLFQRWRVNIWQGVTFNYLTCVVTGSLLAKTSFSSINLNWLHLSTALGMLFFTGFSLSAFSVRWAGVAITTLAAKMSLIVPVLFNLLFVPGTRLSPMVYAGVGLTFPALWLATAKPQTPVVQPDKKALAPILLPAAVFLASGIVDTLINYSNSTLTDPEQQTMFSIASFGTAALTGFLVLFLRGSILKEQLTWKGIVGGLLLGIPNYFSVYLLLQALSAFENNGAWVFPFYNIVIILAASTASVTLFKEKLTPTNRIGLLLAGVAMILLAVAR
ncbi:MAG: hypothetical protein RMJ44_07305 [Cytophagales bacterium]|nr:hypothetical protein [Bernardetiaceae bacterium]MDW8210881.1 hypothetical protein [Cytophagales bacterium]